MVLLCFHKWGAIGDPQDDGEGGDWAASKDSHAFAV